MKFVFVLEDDSKLQTEIVEAIESVDPNIQVRLFISLEQFIKWIKDLQENGPLSIGRAGTPPPSQEKGKDSVGTDLQLVAVVSKIEFLGVRQLPLLKKTRQLFIQQKVCTAEDPTSFVLTTFEDPQFNIKEVEDRILANVIMKPFDRLILAQHLTFAIDGRHPPSKYTIANQKTETVVEMLKAVHMKAWSEVGFVTLSERQLTLKLSVSKYYSDLFRTETKNSLMAKAIDSLPNGQVPEQYACTFAYFGLNPAQIASLRRKVKETSNPYDYSWNKAGPRLGARPFSLLLVEESEASAMEIQDLLRKRIQGLEVVHYISYRAMCQDLDPSLLDEPGAKKTEGVPAFPKDNELTFLFDSHASQVLDVQKAKPDPVMIMGSRDTDVRGPTWWTHHLAADQVKAFRSWLTSGGDLTLRLTAGTSNYYIRPKSSHKDPKTENYHVTFRELSASERNEFLVNQGKFPKGVDAVLMSHRFLNPDQEAKWKLVADAIQKRSKSFLVERVPRLFILSSRDYLDEEMRQWGSFVADIFFRPLDRVYFLQKLLLFFPDLKFSKEPVELTTRAQESTISSANPVKVIELSEAGLVMQYYRPISMGGFREFVLWQAYELAAAKVVATCNSTEEGSEKGLHNNHFVFFGIRDNFLKSIRIWMRENYILAKEKETS